MTYKQAQELIVNRFYNDVPYDPQLGTWFILDNYLDVEPFEEYPQWVRLAILFGGANQVDIGVNPRFRVTGVLVIAIFQRTGTGTPTLYQYADTVIPYFRSKIVNGIHYGTPSLQQVGTERNYWRVNVNCPFFFEVFSG
jgi:hypothetical protein